MDKDQRQYSRLPTFLLENIQCVGMTDKFLETKTFPEFNYTNTYGYCSIIIWQESSFLCIYAFLLLWKIYRTIKVYVQLKEEEGILQDDLGGVGVGAEREVGNHLLVGELISLSALNDPIQRQHTTIRLTEEQACYISQFMIANEGSGSYIIGKQFAQQNHHCQEQSPRV